LYSYFAFGLGIQSELPIPELTAEEVEGDVFIRMDNTEFYSQYKEVDKPFFEMSQKESVLSIESIGTFIIRDGREIIIIPASQADIRRIRRYIVGTVLAILLYQRGNLVLHASSVNIDDQAIAFLGFSGSGKSSIAAALHNHGYGVLADDISVIEMKDNKPVVLPGFPQLKLSLESAEATGCDVDVSMLIDAVDEKYGYRLEHGFTDIPLPLRRIYILEENPRAGVELLSQQTAVIKFISLSIPTLWAQLKDPNQFMQCVNLAKLVPAYSLKRNSSIQALPNFAEFVDEHLRSEIR
jgi:hypothetical protein